jgi:hypothetical protein
MSLSMLGSKVHVKQAKSYRGCCFSRSCGCGCIGCCCSLSGEQQEEFICHKSIDAG